MHSPQVKDYEGIHGETQISNDYVAVAQYRPEIVEGVWKMVFDLVYDGPPFVNTDDLLKKIVDVIYLINCTKRQSILDLYGSIRSRLCKVLVANRNFYNG